MFKPRRDKWGRFAPKRRNIPLKPYKKPNRTATGRFAPTSVTKAKGKAHRWLPRHLRQTGKPILINAYGYYIVVRALVPGGWTTDSTPAFITATPEESLHQIVWRTQTRENLFRVTESSLLADLRDEARELIKGRLNIAKDDQREIIILSWLRNVK